jgi:hypothetical protein
MKTELHPGRKPNGARYNNFETLDVYLAGKQIGTIQCEGVCYGEMREPNHKHGPWKAFVGPDGYKARNLPGWHETQQQAVAAILEWV